MRTLASLFASAVLALTLAACCGDCIKDPPCCPKAKKAPAAAPVAPAAVMPAPK